MTLLQLVLREQQAITLVVLLALSFVLPCRAAAVLRDPAADAQRTRRLAWSGQMFVALCALPVIVVPKVSFVALFAAVACLVFFAGKLRRRASESPAV